MIGNYILISPVRDEERYLETTLRAVINQTLRPYRWIIVDDNSTDKTATILADYARKVEWIQILRLEHKGKRQPGSPVIRAFQAGYQLVANEPFEYVVKFDCDLNLPKDYFRLLVAEFSNQPDLGIASGVYMEKENGQWVPVPMPSYHAAGACKMVRAACFREMNGFIASRGWDTIDEIRAQTNGWKTKHFDDIRFYHLKKEGSAIGNWATNAMHGEIYYRTGGAKLFFLLKVLHRTLTQKPRLLGGLALLWGYLRSWFTREELLVTTEEARFYSRQLNSRIWQVFRQTSVGSSQLRGT